jgi:SMC interacting uncharacterized protein involved in chromosome segregation
MVEENEVLTDKQKARLKSIKRSLEKGVKRLEEYNKEWMDYMGNLPEAAVPTEEDIQQLSKASSGGSKSQTFYGMDDCCCGDLRHN